MIRSVPPFLVRVVAVLVVGICVVLPSALAASPPSYLTPLAMAAKIHGATPQLSTNNSDAPSTITSTVCHGIGTAHQGKFSTFRCVASTVRGPATVWARALPGAKFCASITGLASCPPPPFISGDPRLCSIPSVPATADPNRCALAGAELVIVRAMPVVFNNRSWAVRNLSCTGQNLKWTCQYSSSLAFGTYYHGVITFAHTASAWTGTIAVNTQGVENSTVTCTVQPAATKAGSASNWRAGATPTCAT
jgi:hypothetical protein